MYIYIYIGIYIYICMYMCTYVCVNVCVCVYVLCICIGRRARSALEAGAKRSDINRWCARPCRHYYYYHDEYH